MSKKVKFVLNRSGVREILKSPEMDAALTSSAGGILSSLSEGYSMSLHSYRNRDVVQIYPETKEAKKDNWENHTLTKVI